MLTCNTKTFILWQQGNILLSYYLTPLHCKKKTVYFLLEIPRFSKKEASPQM